MKFVLSLGLLTVASYSFLISITQREQVAQISGSPIYAITNVAVIPLSSQADASVAILQANSNLSDKKERPGDTALGDDSVSEAESDASDESIAASPAADMLPTKDSTPSAGGIAQDVIGNRGRYGKFPLNWLSRKRWGPAGPVLPAQEAKSNPTEEEKITTETSQIAPDPSISEVKTEAEATAAVDEAAVEAKGQGSKQTVDLMPKLLRYTKLLFASRNFFFAYDYDLTRRFSSQDPRRAQLPLHSLVDSLV